MEIMNYLRVQWDRAAAAIALVVGAVALVLGYFGISGTPHVAAQLPYVISGGLFGIFSLGVACMAWLSADLRDEWRELRALRRLLEDDLHLERGRDANGFEPEHGTLDASEDGRPRRRARPLRAEREVGISSPVTRSAEP